MNKPQKRLISGPPLSTTLALLICSFPAFAEVPAPKNRTSALIQGAAAQVGVTLSYDSAYRTLPYPGGDVPIETGVCTDVLIRAFRKADIDLQQLVHEDMRGAFSKYPNHWGLTRPNSSIDHRRVPNLMRFFERSGKSLPVSSLAEDYRPGDVVAWRLPKGLLHIGLVATETTDGGRPLVYHNIGRGTVLEDILFAYEVIGHYRYFSGKDGNTSDFSKDRADSD